MSYLILYHNIAREDIKVIKHGRHNSLQHKTEGNLCIKET